jgi:hypothetical protein
MQKVLLIGYLGRDPEVKYSQQGTAIAQFSVATAERWKDKAGELKEHTEWFAIKAFGRRDRRRTPAQRLPHLRGRPQANNVRLGLLSLVIRLLGFIQTILHQCF